MMQQLLWVMERLQDELAAEEDRKREALQAAERHRTAIGDLQVRRPSLATRGRPSADCNRRVSLRQARKGEKERGRGREGGRGRERGRRNVHQPTNQSTGMHVRPLDWTRIE